MGKIGFRSYDNDDKSPSNGEQSSNSEGKNKSLDSHKDLFRQYIQSKYDVTGDESAKVFKSSRDLVYEAREICSPSLPDVAAVMKELGCAYAGFLDYYAWVLYDKEPLRY